MASKPAIVSLDNHWDMEGNISTQAIFTELSDLHTKLTQVDALYNELFTFDKLTPFTCSHLDDSYEYTVTVKNVTVLAGSSEPGPTDGAASEARFNFPQHLVVKDAKTLLVADRQNNKIRAIDLEVGSVKSLVGTDGSAVVMDGSVVKAEEAHLYSPSSVVVMMDAMGNPVVYLAQEDLQCVIRELTVSGDVRVVAGASKADALKSPPLDRTPALETSFSELTSMCAGKLAGEKYAKIYIPNLSENCIRCFDPITKTISTLLSSSQSNPTDTHFPLFDPYCCTIDPRGRLIIGCLEGRCILRYDPSNKHPNDLCELIAGSYKNSGYTDGFESVLGDVSGIDCDGFGTIYFADYSHGTIRAVNNKGLVYTILSSDPNYTSVNMKLTHPFGIAVDKYGFQEGKPTLYISDFHRIIRLDLAPEILAALAREKEAQESTADIVSPKDEKLFKDFADELKRAAQVELEKKEKAEKEAKVKTDKEESLVKSERQKRKSLVEEIEKKVIDKLNIELLNVDKSKEEEVRAALEERTRSKELREILKEEEIRLRVMHQLEVREIEHREKVKRERALLETMLKQRRQQQLLELEKFEQERIKEWERRDAEYQQQRDAERAIREKEMGEQLNEFLGNVESSVSNPILAGNMSPAAREELRNKIAEILPKGIRRKSGSIDNDNLLNQVREMLLLATASDNKTRDNTLLSKDPLKHIEEIAGKATLRRVKSILVNDMEEETPAARVPPNSMKFQSPMNISITPGARKPGMLRAKSTYNGEATPRNSVQFPDFTRTKSLYALSEDTPLVPPNSMVKTPHFHTKGRNADDDDYSFIKPVNGSYESGRQNLNFEDGLPPAPPPSMAVSHQGSEDIDSPPPSPPPAPPTSVKKFSQFEEDDIDQEHARALFTQNGEHRDRFALKSDDVLYSNTRKVSLPLVKKKSATGRGKNYQVPASNTDTDTGIVPDQSVLIVPEKTKPRVSQGVCSIM